jgi:hypothetical protein
MTKGRKMNNKVFHMDYRATPEEKQAVQLLATVENVKPSELIRILLREGLKNRGYPPPGLVKIAQYFNGKERHNVSN